MHSTPQALVKKSSTREGSAVKAISLVHTNAASMRKSKSDEWSAKEDGNFLSGNDGGKRHVELCYFHALSRSNVHQLNGYAYLYCFLATKAMIKD